MEEVNPNLENADFEGSSSSAEFVSLNKVIPACVYENLPEPLKEITDPFSGREKDVVFLSSLGVISACLPNVFGIYDGRRYAPNLYSFIIAPPASGKGVMNWSKKLIDPIHDLLVRGSSSNSIELLIYGSSDIQGISQKIKILPGNVSSSKCYAHLQDSNEALLIFESEADSLSNMLKQDWGNFSDILRKCFHHETVSISRQSDGRYFQIKKPELSIVLSGTPDQLKPLIDSKDNGLLSRFMFYYFEGDYKWKDVSPRAHRVNYDQLFEEKAEDIKWLYLRLKNCEEIEVLLTDSQWAIFQLMMEEIANVIIDSPKRDFLPTIMRFGVIFFRICMILTCLRNMDVITDSKQKLIAIDRDVNTALQIVKILIDHSLLVSSFYEKNAVKMTITERNLFSQLPQNFKRGAGLELATQLGIPERTFDELLKKWLKQNVLDKINYGEYQKK